MSTVQFNNKPPTQVSDKPFRETVKEYAPKVSGKQAKQFLEEIKQERNK